VLGLLSLAAMRLDAEDSPLPLRDPLRPFTAALESGPSGTAPRRLELQAVVVSPQRRIAVINDELRREGDHVDGALIVQIENRSVRLRRAGEDFVLWLDGRIDSVTTPGDSTP